MKMKIKDENKITAALIGGMFVLYAMFGLMLLIGFERFMYLGALVFVVMAFFLIGVPIIDRLFILFTKKIIEIQNKEKQ